MMYLQHLGGTRADAHVKYARVIPLAFDAYGLLPKCFPRRAAAAGNGVKQKKLGW